MELELLYVSCYDTGRKLSNYKYTKTLLPIRKSSYVNHTDDDDPAHVHFMPENKCPG